LRHVASSRNVLRSNVQAGANALGANLRDHRPRSPLARARRRRSSCARKSCATPPVVPPGRSGGGAGSSPLLSNGADQSTALVCSSATLGSEVGVTAGSEWQCPELINRLYPQQSGWTSTAVGQRQSALRHSPAGTLEAGKRLDHIRRAGRRGQHQEKRQRNSPAGWPHAAIVNTAGPVTSGTVLLVSFPKRR